jgi:hypothetical protein
MVNMDNLIEEIAQTVFDNVPVDNWNKVVVNVAMLTTYVELTATYYVNDVKGKSFDANYPGAPDSKMIDNLFIELRKAMYTSTPQKGAWFNAEMTITVSGKFGMTYDYDNKPDFEMTPEDEEFIVDSKEFPRDNVSTPAWLKDILPGQTPSKRYDNR